MAWELIANVKGPAGVKGDTGSTGAAGADGANGAQGPQGNPGAVQTLLVPFVMPIGPASAAATNIAASTFNPVSDPSLRMMVDLRGLTKMKLVSRIGGALVPATMMRVQYHTGGNINVASGDAGWTTLYTSSGSHTINTMFENGEVVVPAEAQIQNCLLRVGIFGGNGTADPTITCAVARFYQ